MFTGLDSENIPSVKLWDFSKANSGTQRVGLTNDCAPVQYFATGGSTTGIIVLLPSGCVDGKTIKIVNSNWTSSRQNILICASDNGGTGNSVTVYSLGANQTLDLCYLKSAYNTNGFAGFSTNWVSLNQGSGLSSGIYSTTFGFNNNADGGYAFAAGGYGNIATGTACSVIAGNFNTAQTSNTFVGGGNNNNANGNNAAVIGGSSNQAVNSTAAVVGGSNGYASGNNSAVIAGDTNTASAFYSVVVGGAVNIANANNSSVIGGSRGTTRTIIGNTVFPATSTPIASAYGVSQSALLVLGVQTTDATATVLRSNTSAAGTTNQVILPDNSAYYVKGRIIANVTGAGNTKSWEFTATIKRGAGVGTTAIVGAVALNIMAADAGASTWTVAITADTTNGGLAVTVTGQASTTIRWVCKIETTEVTY